MSKSTNKKDNPMTMISIRLPEDMVTELKRVAPLIGESGYQPLIRTYIEQGLAKDLEKIDAPRSINYHDEAAKAEAARANRVISEARAEYIVRESPEFVVGPPLEWNVAVNEEAEEKTWGKNMVALLNSFSETGWEDVDDPVEWVAEARKRRKDERERRL